MTGFLKEDGAQKKNLQQFVDKKEEPNLGVVATADVWQEFGTRRAFLFRFCGCAPSICSSAMCTNKADTQ